MRACLGMLVFAVPFVAVLACGGRVDGIRGDAGGTCPTPAAIVDGTACSENGTTCPWIESGCANLSCTCSGGSWLCEHSNGIACQVCPTQATVGGSCSSTEQGCSVSTPYYGCGGVVAGYTQCTCAASEGASFVWDCAGGGSPPSCVDAQACPAPATIALDAPCDVGADLTCPSDIAYYDCNGDVVGYASCTCGGGTWYCPLPGVPACPDAGGPCPPPNDVVQDTACSTELQDCPGNPQVCGGQVLYDAFECQGGLWQDVAVTFCDLDASGGSSSGGGGSIDGGAAD